MEGDFPGQRELASLLATCEVKIIDENGSLELRSFEKGDAPVIGTVPVEAAVNDSDGMTIRLLLHVRKGRPIELDIYKDDGSPIIGIPPASSFEISALTSLPSTP